MKLDIYDIFIFIGMIVLGIGLWLYNPIISLCVMGIILILFGLLGAFTVKKGGGN